MSRGLAMRTVYACGCAALLVVVGCSSTHMGNQEGGETHFLEQCLDGVCEGGLTCVCGVCTKACDGDSACAALGSNATCNAVEPDSLICGDDARAEERVCDVICARSSECEPLGDSHTCIEGRCRPEAIASALAGAADAGGAEGGMDSGGDAGDACPQENCGASVAPLVMILLDTSGSMERRPRCACATPGCTECLPDCAGESPDKNRWTQALEALTGTYDEFDCEAITRNGPSFTYDADYAFPYHRPTSSQRDDGLLREYGSRLRFGLATFDTVSAYAGEPQLAIDDLDFARSASEDGMWSYPPAESADELTLRSDGHAVGSYRYPGCATSYLMNTGIRSRDASAGGLIVDTGDEPDPTTVAAIEDALRDVRPFGGTPIAAALDDIQWLFASDSFLRDERGDPGRQRHLILITDGRPDDDFRNVNCDCALDGDDSDCGFIGDDSAPMHCPYPTVEEAARRLRCGDSEGCEAGTFETIHVIGFDLLGEVFVEDKLDAIAHAAGTASATRVDDGEELRRELDLVLRGIAEGSSHNDGGVPGPTGGDAELANGACEMDGLVYASGATWRKGCNECECTDGSASCEDNDCQACLSDFDCLVSDVCILGPSCTAGQCSTLPEESDAPINVDQVCDCYGETYRSQDVWLAFRSGGIAHPGACEPASCTYNDFVLNHGAMFDAEDECNKCRCIDGEVLCTSYPCTSCASTEDCAPEEHCELPVNVCESSGERIGKCVVVPASCPIDDPWHNTYFCSCINDARIDQCWARLTGEQRGSCE
jgi:hypothetical protein